MTTIESSHPTFNLWTEPWIALERLDGGMEAAGLAGALLHAHEFGSIHEPSPLVVVGVQRLLTAILQWALKPQRLSDIRSLWQRSAFPADGIQAFGKAYRDRFDLFCDEQPFMQSADLPSKPARGDQLKTVAYLAPELPAATEITHFRHGADSRHWFCPSCLAGGLAAVPAFATSGGSGIKPSINGVPPIYVLPGGPSLFHSLTLSLVTPEYRPDKGGNPDQPWWARQPVVPRSTEVQQVGYVQSLTFPARRVRLHPAHADRPCTRCGRSAAWGASTMVFEMGESRPKEAPFWRDPFAAYTVSEGKAAPTPIRPKPGQAVWREFAALFLQHDEPAISASAKRPGRKTLRPHVLDQMAALDLEGLEEGVPFRCVGIRTDMKAKVFEWIDAGFEVPPKLLADPRAAVDIDRALTFATDCAGIAATTFAQTVGAKSQSRERHRQLKARLQDDVWAQLAQPFRTLVLHAGDPGERGAALRAWLDFCVRAANSAFERAAAAAGDNAVNLQQQAIGEDRCRARLAKRRKEALPSE